MGECHNHGGRAHCDLGPRKENLGPRTRQKSGTPVGVPDFNICVTRDMQTHDDENDMDRTGG